MYNVTIYYSLIYTFTNIKLYCAIIRRVTVYNDYRLEVKSVCSFVDLPNMIYSGHSPKSILLLGR